MANDPTQKTIPDDKLVAPSNSWRSMINYLSPPPDFSSLRETPKKVVDYVLSGKSNEEIAELIGITPATVRTCTTRALQSLGVQNKAELMQAAIAANRIPIPVGVTLQKLIDGHHRLSQNEKTVMKMAAAGEDFDIIAKVIDKPSTAVSPLHVDLKRKLGLHSLRDLVVASVAIENGLAAGIQPSPSEKFAKLGQRQCEILDAILQGYDYGCIGDMLGISRKTVANLAKSGMKRLGASNQAELFRIAIALNIRQLPTSKSQDNQIESHDELLTHDQQEVMQRVAAGERIKDIAKATNRSPKTVSEHLSRAKSKLGLHSLAELVTASVAIERTPRKPRTTVSAMSEEDVAEDAPAPKGPQAYKGSVEHLTQPDDAPGHVTRLQSKLPQHRFR